MWFALFNYPINRSPTPPAQLDAASCAQTQIFTQGDLKQWEAPKGLRASAHTFVMCVEWQESRLFTNVQQDADQKYTHAATKVIKAACVQLILCNNCNRLISELGINDCREVS